MDGRQASGERSAQNRAAWDTVRGAVLPLIRARRHALSCHRAPVRSLRQLGPSPRKWCPGAESNHRHGDFQSPALPTELPGQRLAGASVCRARTGQSRSKGGAAPRVGRLVSAIVRRAPRAHRLAAAPGLLEPIDGRCRRSRQHDRADDRQTRPEVLYTVGAAAERRAEGDGANRQRGHGDGGVGNRRSAGFGATRRLVALRRTRRTDEDGRAAVRRDQAGHEQSMTAPRSRRLHSPLHSMAGRGGAGLSSSGADPGRALRAPRGDRPPGLSR